MSSSTLVDRVGRPYTPMMEPSLRLGRKPANAGQKYPAEVYSASEVLALMDVMGRGARGRSITAAARNRAALVVMWRAGLRLGEVLALEPRDVDLDVGAVTVRHGKGNRRRVVGIDRWGSEILAEWMERRAALIEHAFRGPLFMTVTRGYGNVAVAPTNLRDALKDAGYKAEIAKRVHPHGFRHTFADELQREGFPLFLIQMALGHSDLETTAVYLNHLRPHELLTRMRDRPGPLL